MRVSITLAALLVTLAGCAGPGQAASYSRASAPPAAGASPTEPIARVSGPLAVMEKDFLVDGGPNYTVSLVGLDGRTVASATAAKRLRAGMPPVQVGNLSVSATRLYYLDGA